MAGMDKEMEKYKEIFTQIEDTLRKESKLSREEFEARFGKYKALSYKNMKDKEIFWTLVKIIFYSGMRASTVTQRLSAIKKYLYDFQKVKDYTEEKIKEILKDPDVIHHRRKIEACINNAKAFNELLNQYGSFRKYLESFGELSEDDTIERLRTDLIRRFQYLGKRTVNHFLMDLGLNVLKPDRVICRIFKRLGLIENENNVGEIIEVGRKIAAANRLPIRYIDICFVKYGQKGRDEKFGLDDGICLEEKPKCNKCGINKKYCNYYAGTYR